MPANFTSTYLLDNDCSSYTVSSNMFKAISALKAIFLLPLSIVILYLGHQQWKQHLSFKTASHSDIFTYHMAAMELIWVFGCLCSFDGNYSNHSVMITVGSIASNTGLYGETGFHILTCVERYLAVVHPIIYLGLKNSHGIKIRNISIFCVWLFSFGLIGVHRSLISDNRIVPLFCVLALCMVITSFCSLSVLCALIHPGPGEGGKEKEWVDQSKRKAFHIITAITCAVWLWFIGLLVTKALGLSHLLSNPVRCVVEMSGGFFNLPSCLVLPLLFLQRADRLRLLI